MKTILAGSIAAAAIVALAGGAQAAPKNVCVWTGADWACGDGNGTFPQHYSAAQGPNVTITPARTTVMPAKEPRPYSPPPGAY